MQCSTYRQCKSWQRGREISTLSVTGTLTLRRRRSLLHSDYLSLSLSLPLTHYPLSFVKTWSWKLQKYNTDKLNPSLLLVLLSFTTPFIPIFPLSPASLESQDTRLLTVEAFVICHRTWLKWITPRKSPGHRRPQGGRSISRLKHDEERDARRRKIDTFICDIVNITSLLLKICIILNYFLTEDAYW